MSRKNTTHVGCANVQKVFKIMTPLSLVGLKHFNQFFTWGNFWARDYFGPKNELNGDEVWFKQFLHNNL